MIIAACAPAHDETPVPTLIPLASAPLKPTYEVSRGDIIRQLQFTARVVPVEEQALFFRIDGSVQQVYVEEGDFVSEGQVLADLAVIGDLARRHALDALALRRAELHLEIAEMNLRLTEARAQPETKEIEIGIKQVEVELAQVALDEARLSIQDIDLAVQNAQIIAPFDGQVMSINTSEGRTVRAFDPVMVIADPGALELSAFLRQMELEELVAGMPATLSPRSRPGQTLTGSVRRLPYRYSDSAGAAAPAASQDTSVRIALDAPAAEAGLVLGDQLTVTVVLERKEDVLWLPAQAIRIFGGRQFVVVREDNIERRVDVVLGLKGDDRVEIVEGLSEGQVVAAP
ncbi:MAG: efflux RND transporter periplasmic adaptor subunit [Anaerolineae bacterium]|nr:efflux RND transporter periplasmic adaptor subunit [Anaerolineae bacterium]